MIHMEPDVLVEARDDVRPHLRSAVARLQPGLRRMAEYHFGWVDEEGRPADVGGGKGLRPALAVLSAEAVGHAREEGVAGAVAIELIHNFALIHDDIMDGDIERRHRPTVWSLFGVGPAIVLGDALMVLAQQVILDTSSPHRMVASQRLTRATAEMISGQASDLANASSLDVGLGETTRMASEKTGALFECAASIGAVLGCGLAPPVEALGTYGRNLGIAFQAVDDILGIWGSPETTGKPVGSDLRERKMSLPVVAALRRGGAGAVRLEEILANGEPPEADVAEAAALIDANGGREWTLDEARRRCGTALEAIADAGLASRVRRHLESLAMFITDRDY